MSATPAAAASNESGGDDLRLVLPGRTLLAAAGWEWIAEGWKLFARAPLMWIVALVILLVIFLVLLFLPFVGGVAIWMSQAIFMAGFMIACRSLETGGQFELEHLFAGFKRNFAGLLLLGLLLLVGVIVIFLVFGGFVGLSVLSSVVAASTQEDIAAIALASGATILLGTLVMLLLMVPLVAAYWFAPALVVMHGVAPVAAMKASLAASFRNWVPFLVYSIVMSVFALLALIPVGLGMIVWIPVAITSTYVAYRRIFTEEAAAAV